MAEKARVKNRQNLPSGGVVINGTKYSRIYQMKFVEDSF